MTPLPPFPGASRDAAPTEAPNPLIPAPANAAPPAAPFGLAIQQALSEHDQPGAELETAPRETAEDIPAPPDAGPCPAWACLVQLAPAPVPTAPQPTAPAFTGHHPSRAVPTVTPATSPATPGAAVSVPQPKAGSGRALLPQGDWTPVPTQPAAALLTQAGTQPVPMPVQAVADLLPSNQTEPDQPPAPPVQMAVTPSGSPVLPADRSDRMAAQVSGLLPDQGMPDWGWVQTPPGRANRSPAPASPPGSSPGWESPPTPVLPVVSAATSPWETPSPTARLDPAPADPGTGPAPAPATFAPPPGKNVTAPPADGPILSPAKDGTNGAQLTGVMTAQAETSTAQAEKGPMLPTSGTGTVPAVSSSTARTPGAGLSTDLTRSSLQENEVSRPETRLADAALDRTATPFTQPFPADRLAPLDGAAELPESEAAAPSPAASLERLEIQLRERVVEFRERRLDTLSVVLRPDAGTELHLQLRLHGQQVEVIAHCARGDAAGLQSQWHQLQQSLAGQGVRLAGLETGAGDSRRQPAPQPPPSEPAGVPALSSVPRTGQPLPARPTLGSRRLLESWA